MKMPHSDNVLLWFDHTLHTSFTLLLICASFLPRPSARQPQLFANFLASVDLHLPDDLVSLPKVRISNATWFDMATPHNSPPLKRLSRHKLHSLWARTIISSFHTLCSVRNQILTHSSMTMGPRTNASKSTYFRRRREAETST